MMQYKQLGTLGSSTSHNKFPFGIDKELDVVLLVDNSILLQANNNGHRCL